MQVIASRIRRALRNETGVNLSLAQLCELASYGIIEEILKIEADELCRNLKAPTGETHIGSTNDVTATRPTLGKSPRPEHARAGRDRSYITALAANA